jgi:hypothetical protein
MHIGFPQATLVALLTLSTAAAYPSRRIPPHLRPLALINFRNAVIGSIVVVLIVWWGGFFG